VSPWLIALCGLIYFYVSCEQWDKDANLWGMYLGYAFSNIWLYRSAGGSFAWIAWVLDRLMAKG
jgi:hypothetical protein